MTAHELLVLALGAALDRGLRIPCGMSDAWLSDDADERAQAARECDGCPCIAECAAAAESTSERFGVWGGVDLTPAKRRMGRPRRAS